MRAWIVSDENDACVYVRAESEEDAIRFWPGINYDDVTALPCPHLNGPGPAREIDVVRIECPHVAEGKIDRDWQSCKYFCWDGGDRWEIIDWEATFKQLGGT